jgi:hypothetical protein
MIDSLSALHWPEQEPLDIEAAQFDALETLMSLPRRDDYESLW